MNLRPNYEALNKALGIYRSCMRDFIISQLRNIRSSKVENVVIDSLNDAGQSEKANEIFNRLAVPDADIKSMIDIGDFPHLIQRNWNEIFREPLNYDNTFRDQLWLIRNVRNIVAHPSEADAESEWTRAHLFHIADVLEKINNLDDKQEVERIRDELFSNDTLQKPSDQKPPEAPEQLAEIKQQLSDATEQLTKFTSESADLEAKNELKQQLSDTTEQLAKLTSESADLEAKNTQLQYSLEVAQTENRMLEAKLEEAKSYQERFIVESYLRQTAEKTLETQRTQINEVINQTSSATAKHEAVGKDLTIATLGDTTLGRTIVPPLYTESRVRLLDRRGTDKPNYLFHLLNQKQPAIIYVQTEERIDQFLDIIQQRQPDIVPLIGTHNERTSEAEEMETLEKLKSRELTTIISHTIFSTLTEEHPLQHFVFCHPAPGVETFYKQCEPAFTATKPAYLHLIYDPEQEQLEGLPQQYPDSSTLKYLYEEVQSITSGKDSYPPKREKVFVTMDELYDKISKKFDRTHYRSDDSLRNSLCRLTLETAVSIFEELDLLKQNEKGIGDVEKVHDILYTLTTNSYRKSETYSLGESLKEQTADFQTFQQQHTLDQIWDAILKNLNIDPNQL